MENKMVKKLKEMEMTIEMKERIIRNCVMKAEENTMNKNTRKIFSKKPMVAVATLLLCVCTVGVTSLAATGKLEGFFRDIKGWNGAVIGTAYEQATDEVEVSVVEVTEELIVEVKMLEPETVPYSVLETIGVENYKIVDEDNNVVVEGTTSEMVEIVEGKAYIKLSMDATFSGEYKLIITGLVGGAKAEQPLVMSGTWECEFTK